MFQYTFHQSLVGHKEPIYRLLDYDSTHFLSASGDGIVAKWSIDDFSSVAIAKSNATVYALQIYNNRLAIGNNRGGFHCLDIQQGKMICSLQFAQKAIFSIEHYATQNQLFIADGEGRLTIVNGESFEVIKQLQLSTKSLRCIAINHSQSLVAIGGSDHIIRLYSLPNWQQISTLTTHENSVFTCRFVNDHTLISGGRDARLRLFDVIEEEQCKEIPAHLYTINSIDEGDYSFVTGSRDKSFKIWDKEWNIKKVFTQEKYPDILKHSVNAVLVKENYIFTAGDDRAIHVWKRQ